ncbi:phage tail protein [Azospirillum picis]|uniref:Microcystin-dependent protein n=1 Tax=Azospirillum picis TaxID=488438 RepID=A0ABU0MDT7_9PROT|nr:tail fiber protein [Azospirillum picis]MBP2297377.1 microcystin-dependent protein [Azospirillum picis]MDQ0531600.1 microcystin-dependent protein [Azospirillum picis]
MKAAFLSACTLASLAAIVATSKPAAACGDDAYVGQVCVMPGSYCPNNTMEAAGQLLPINPYNGLYSLVGVTYGGDGRTTFGLPDLRGRTPVHYGQGPGLTNHPIGSQFGQEGVSQTVGMLAPHAHAAMVSGSGGAPAQVNARQVDGTTNVPQAGYMLAQGTNGLDPSNTYIDPTVSSGTDVALGGVSGGGLISSVTIGNTGAGTAIPTVSPSLATRYCIVVNGIYPPRP